MSGCESADLIWRSSGSFRVNLHRGMKRLREGLGVATEEVSDVG